MAKKMGVMLRLGTGVVVAGVALSLAGRESIKQWRRDAPEIEREVAAAIEAGRPDVVAALTPDKEAKKAAKRVVRRAKVARGVARRALLAKGRPVEVVEENQAVRKGPPKFYRVQLTPDRRTKFYAVRS